MNQQFFILFIGKENFLISILTITLYGIFDEKIINNNDNNCYQN